MKGCTVPGDDHLVAPGEQAAGHLHRRPGEHGDVVVEGPAGALELEGSIGDDRVDPAGELDLLAIVARRRLADLVDGGRRLRGSDGRRGHLDRGARLVPLGAALVGAIGLVLTADGQHRRQRCGDQRGPGKGTNVVLHGVSSPVDVAVTPAGATVDRPLWGRVPAVVGPTRLSGPAPATPPPPRSGHRAAAKLCVMGAGR
jgi:hypothetical protein